MADVLAGLKVLDLTRGIAGPMTGMLLADHGAQVTRIEPPGGDPFQGTAGYRVWNRGKRSAEIDLTTPAGRDALLALADGADVLIESFAPGTTTRLGIDFATVHARNPRLIYCSITGYGRDNRHADRPGIDGLVAARSGVLWEKRGVTGGQVNRLSGAETLFPDLEVPEGAKEGPPREGPLFFASPVPSLGAFYFAATGISAALRARGHTGRGQWVETSLLQGVIAATGASWHRVEHPDAPHYQTYIKDGRAPLGMFKCADGVWVHNWVPNPRWTLAVSQGDTLELEGDGRQNRDDPDRVGTEPENVVVLHYYYPQLVEAFAKYPSTDWIRAGAAVGIPIQRVRPPMDALLDGSFVEDGCVAEVDDPEAGRIRMVGSTYRITGPDGPVSSGAPKGPAPRLGEHTAEVLAEAAAAGGTVHAAASDSPALASPLAGVKVLDLGLAIAGPFGGQVLADMGADVIKVNALHDTYWQSNQIAFMANRNKRSLAVNLKEPEGMEILHRLVRESDVVHHNMRYDAAVRLGVDYESLRKVNPRIIYCHTRGFPHGPLEALPSNDQMGAAVAGQSWEDGGSSDGGRPMWARTSFGDTGNGFLSAIGVIQALYHRDRTGEGQFVDTAITYASLLNASYTYATPDGVEASRWHLDAMHYGLHPLYRLYETSDGWLCIAVLDEDGWRRLATAIGRVDLQADRRFATAADRDANADALAEELAGVFAQEPAAKWFSALDGEGVPCEVTTPDFCFDLLDDPEMHRRRWVADYHHPFVGRIEQFGIGVDFSETPAALWGATPVVGQHTEEILREAGYRDEEIADLARRLVVWTWYPGKTEDPPAGRALGRLRRKDEGG